MDIRTPLALAVVLSSFTGVGHFSMASVDRSSAAVPIDVDEVCDLIADRNYDLCIHSCDEPGFDPDVCFEKHDAAYDCCLELSGEGAADRCLDLAGHTCDDDRTGDNDDDGTTGCDANDATLVLKGTGKDSGKRKLSKESVSVEHEQPDCVTETREFRYSTPKNFANRADGSINLWFVFHGVGGTSKSMHEFFEEIPHDAPSLLVYPQALKVDVDNVVAATTTRWRVVRTSGQESEPDAFRDVVFIDWLATELLKDNPQLNPNKIYVSGFSSGGAMSWMLLCYRSERFQGFAMYSKQLGSALEDGGCGDGQAGTGYEELTGRQPDKYGHGMGSPAPTKAVLYAHGTADNNLLFDDKNKNSDLDNPDRSMDPGGPLQNRDDKSTVNWLASRHQISKSYEELVPDPNGNSDGVWTYIHHYPSDADGKAIDWYEMWCGGHKMSSLDRTDNKRSDDYDISTQTQKFFESEAGMFRFDSGSRTIVARPSCNSLEHRPAGL